MALHVLLGITFLPFLAEASPHCNKAGNINMVLYNLPPLVDQGSSSEGHQFSGLFIDKIYGSILRSCKACERDSFNGITVNVTRDVNQFLNLLEDDNTDIAFPVPAEILELYMDRNHSRDAAFLLAYTTKRFALVRDTAECRSKQLMEMFNLITEQWPIITLTLMLAGVAGVIMWMLEARTNTEEFPRSFLKGTYEGFWWAFVSMTTVGYGDKCPRTLMGRLFGVFWIMIGIIVISFFTATFSSAITVSIVSNECQKILGKTVGVLNNTMGDEVALNNGASSVEIKNTVEELLSLQKSKQVDGIFVDDIMAFYYLHPPNNTSSRVEKSVKITNTFPSNGTQYYTMYRRLPCQIRKQNLVLHSKHDKSFIDVYKQHAQSATSSEEVEQPFSSKSNLTEQLMIGMACTLAGLLILAFLCDLAMRTCCKTTLSIDTARRIEMANIKQTQQNGSIETSLQLIIDEIEDIKTRLQEMEKGKG